MGADRIVTEGGSGTDGKQPAADAQSTPAQSVIGHGSTLRGDAVAATNALIDHGVAPNGNAAADRDSTVGGEPREDPIRSSFTSTRARGGTLPSKVIRPRFVVDEFFGHQPTPTSSLPDPEPLLVNLTRCVVEILAGARDLEQIARWVTDDVYRHLLKRTVLSARARQAKGQKVIRPSFSIGSTTIFEPRDGVVEAVVIVRGRARTRAVALRLEGLDKRWRASAINVL